MGRIPAVTLFDPSPFAVGPLVAEDTEEGPFRVEVWAPTGNVWIPMDRVVEGCWTFDSFDDALEASFGWIELGTVLDPTARIVDESTDEPAWSSCGPKGPFRTVIPNPMYL